MKIPITKINELPKPRLEKLCRQVTIMFDDIQKEYKELMIEGDLIPLWERTDKKGMEMLMRCALLQNDLIPLMELFNHSESYLRMISMSMKVASDAIEAKQKAKK